MSVEVKLEKTFDKLIGEVLASRYQIESKIGEGAMGAVYRAKHVKVGRAFAVKVLHPRLLEDHKVLQRFEREAELAGRLRHPNVIGVVDVGETNDSMRYMVMDFAEGPDLATMLNEAPMPPQRIIHIVRQLLEGLYHAHEAGLIHRDFKPENVIIERDSNGNEVPRIVDFGIAILREGGDSTGGTGRLTTNGLVLGTPHYMAPEQAVADPIDHRIDLFALGIIIYEMLCGRLPFDGSGAEVARANLLLDPPPISQRVPYLEVDPLLEAFARRLMAKKRDARPATAKAARELLDLVERDRTAAAAKLGISPDAAREPMVTQPNAPMREHHGKETFPPPIRGEGPRAGTPKAVAAVDNAGRASTQQTEVKRRRAPVIIAGLAGAGVLAGALFIMLNGKDDKPAPSVAVAPEPVKTEPAPPPTTEPAPPPTTELAKTEPTKTEPTPGQSVVPPVVEDAATTRPVIEPKPATQPKPTRPKVTKTVVKTPAKTPTPPPPTTTPPQTPPVQTTKVEPRKPVDPKGVDASTLVAQYKTVGGQLKALQDAKGPDEVNDLWARYRMINIVDSLKTPEKRDGAASVLAKLANEIAVRKKK